MKAYTDYPFICIGDKPNKKAPIREVEVLSYDGDKYCLVKFGRVYESIKSGYLYQKPGRIGEVPRISREQLDMLPKTCFE